MRTILLIIAALSLLLSSAGLASPVFADEGQGKNVASDRLVVQFEPGTSWSEMIRVHQRVGGKVVASIPEIEVQVVTVPRHQKFFKSWLYRLHKEVCRVESDYVVQVLDAPNDPYFDQQWGMTKVQAPQAWDITQGNPNICIAILDTGIDSSHTDLASKIVSKENFSDSDTVEDRHGHGTHCAGVAAAITDNNIGVAGLGYNSSLMNVKVLGDSGYGYYSQVAEGIVWAADHGANVISMSLGGSSSSSTLKQAIDYAWSHGVVVAAAAGNDGSSNPSYPAYYTNCIAIAATDVNDNLASWSNHGDWVDVAAPGVSIYSTFPDGYKYWSGTSMACPHVVGLAALVFSIADDTNNNGWLNDEVRYRIEATCDDIGIDGIGTGRINAYKAVQELSPIGQISGTVTDASTRQAINGATVTNGLRSTTTDSNGNYTLAYVAQGTYTVTASASHYYQASQEATVVAGETSTADFSLTPKSNQAPILDPIGDKAVDEGQLLQFTIHASDPDGDTLTYSANNLPEGANFTGQTFFWTPNYEQAETYQVTFKVQDGWGGEDSEAITITVSESLPGQISGTVTDASTDQPIFGATVTAGTRSATTDSNGSYTIPDVPAGTYTLSASADGHISASKTITVSPGETTIADFSLALMGSMWAESITFTPYSEGLLLKIKVVNPEPVERAKVNGKVQYNGWDKWSFCGITNSAGETTLRLRGAKEGEYLAIITGLTHEDYFWDKSKGVTSASYTYGTNTGQISGTVTDGYTTAPIEAATVTDGTRSATTDSNGKYTITDVPEGTYTLSASASGYQNASQTVTVVAGETSTANFSLTPKPNQPPILDPIGDKVIDEGQLLEFTIHASDPDGDQLTYSASNLPQGATFASQTFSWTPASGQAGSYTVTFTVSDGELSDFETITITVNGVNTAPTLDPIGNKSVNEGELLEFTISATDPDGDQLTYSASNLPQGATFVGQTFSWTPDYAQAGTYEATFTVSDGKLSDFETITITVNDIALTGKISGTVTDADTGEPIANATVTDGTRSASTDSNGSYTLANVPEGTWTLTASANGYQSSSQTVSVSPGETTTADFSLVRESPPNTMWVESITLTPYSEGLLLKIKVVNPEPVKRAKVNGKVQYNGWNRWSFCGITNSAGETTLRLRGASEGEYLAIITSLTHSQYLWDKSKGISSASYTYGTNRGQVSGSVTDASTTAPIEGATVTDGTRSATTDSNGKYTITDVPEGTYTLTASADGYQNASQPVSVVGDETSTANFSLTPIVNHPPVLAPIGDKSVSEGELLEFTISASDADGDQLSYSASNLPGGATFADQTFTWTPDYGQARTYEVTFTVSDGELSDSETITITVNHVSLPGKISGTVTDADTGEPIANATVSDGARSTTTNSNGVYTLADVPQGTYTFTASANGYQSSSKTVTVSPGGTTTADFSLVKESPPNTMWIESITFTPYSEGLLLKIKVVNPEPVERAKVNGKVKYNGWDKWSFCGITNSAGETTLRLRGAKEGEYLAIITSLTHEDYLWDKSKGISSASYTFE